MKTKYQIKTFKRTTKNGKNIILPILVNVDDDSDALLVNQGFSVTLTLDQDEIAKLVESGKLYSSKQARNQEARKQKAKSKKTDVVV